MCLIFSCSTLFGQTKFGDHKYIFSWSPNPNQSLLKHSSEFLRSPDIDTIKMISPLIFEVAVDISNQNILSVRYSELNIEYNFEQNQLKVSQGLIKKVENFLLYNVKVSKITSLNGGALPKDTLTYFMNIDIKKNSKRNSH
jgi:hypothetical protein